MFTDLSPLYNNVYRCTLFSIINHGKLAKPVLSGGVAASISITAFPVIYLVLEE